MEKIQYFTNFITNIPFMQLLFHTLMILPLIPSGSIGILYQLTKNSCFLSIIMLKSR